MSEKYTKESVDMIYDTAKRISYNQGFLDGYKRGVEDAKEKEKEEPKGSALDLMILTLANFIENEPDEDKVDLDDCKQMLGKLKAWQRLKDKGFEFKRWNTAFCEIDFDVPDSFYPIDGNMITNETEKDLDLLFGGEE